MERKNFISHLNEVWYLKTVFPRFFVGFFFPYIPQLFGSDTHTSQPDIHQPCCNGPGAPASPHHLHQVSVARTALARCRWKEPETPSPLSLHLGNWGLLEIASLCLQAVLFPSRNPYLSSPQWQDDLCDMLWSRKRDFKSHCRIYHSPSSLCYGTSNVPDHPPRSQLRAQLAHEGHRLTQLGLLQGHQRLCNSNNKRSLLTV